jgi:hypothetical protein
MSALRTQKLEAQLELTERALRERLLALLPAAVEQGVLLFTNSQFNPSGFPTHRLLPQAEAILSDARTCIHLREQLGMPTTGSIGLLYLQACEESARSEDEHRRGPRRLAEALLATLSARG